MGCWLIRLAKNLQIYRFPCTLCSLSLEVGGESGAAFVWDMLSRLVSSFCALVVSCVLLGWLSTLESFSPLPSGFLSQLWFGRYLEWWLCKPRLCVERTHIQEAFSWIFDIISSPFPSLPVSCATVENFAGVAASDALEREWLLLQPAQLQQIFEFPYQGVFWVVYEQRGSIYLRAKQVCLADILPQKRWFCVQSSICTIPPCSSLFWCSW